jgi:asparagine synthase (glutamine-hydrolysing)
VCGIAGVLVGESGPAVTEDELVAMAAVVGHRGPDGHGLYVSPRVGLVSTRLSIIDIEGGFQPLCNERRDVWLVHNGEIFNHVELRAWLVSRGHRFRTSSDSEVIAHAWEELGRDTWTELNGQFAVALWDRRAGELWLVRDRLGIHPLLHARVGDAIVFGSEAKSLFAGGRATPAPDPQGLLDTFTRWSPSAPRTAFAGVRQVRPGTMVRYEADLRATEWRYWSIRFPEAGAGDSGLESLDAAAEAIDAAVDAAIRLRLRADVPVGAYLSGGLDSSYVAAKIRRLHEGRLDTFGVRFDDPAFDETAEQRRMAADLGTDHHDVLATSADIAAALPDVVWHAEQPLVRTAPVPMYLLSRLVSANGFRVAMTGEGADEWFAGYSLFKEDRVRRFWARQPGSQMRPALLGRLHPEIGRDLARQSPYWRAFFGRGLEETDDLLYSHGPRWRTAAWANRLLSQDIRAEATEAASYRAVLDELPDGFDRWSPLARAQTLEIQTFLSSYLLVAQGDRVGLGHAVELRYPFLDMNVVDLASRLPDRHKLLGLRDKLVLRRAASRLLRPEVAARQKQPYRAPLASVLRAFGRESVVPDLLSPEAIERIGLLDVGAAGRLIAQARRIDRRPPGEREEMAMIGVITMQIWGERFLERFGPSVAAATEAYRVRPPRILERHPDGEPFSVAVTT